MNANTKIPTDDLPVVLSLELASAEMTLSELQAMEAGSFVEMFENWPKRLYLKANGKNYFSGELVKIDGKVAFRVLEVL